MRFSGTITVLATTGSSHIPETRIRLPSEKTV